MSDVSGACERIDFFVCRCEHPRCLFGSYRHDEKRALWIACVRRVRNAVIFFLGREKVKNATVLFHSVLGSFCSEDVRPFFLFPRHRWKLGT